MLNGTTYIVRPVEQLFLLSDTGLCRKQMHQTFHAVRETFLNVLLKIVRRHPVSKLTSNAFLAARNGLTALRSNNKRPAFNPSYISWVSASQPAKRSTTQVNLESLFKVKWVKYLPVVHLGQRFEHTLLMHQLDKRTVFLLRSITNVNMFRLTKTHTIFNETAHLVSFKWFLQNYSAELITKMRLDTFWGKVPTASRRLNVWLWHVVESRIFLAVAPTKFELYENRTIKKIKSHALNY